MELAVKILAGLNVVQLVAMVLVVWLLTRRPAGITHSAQPVKAAPAMVQEKQPAFYQGVNGIIPGQRKETRIG